MANVFEYLQDDERHCYVCHSAIKRHDWVEKLTCGHLYHHSCVNPTSSCANCSLYEIEMKFPDNSNHTLFMRHESTVKDLFRWCFKVNSVQHDQLFISLNNHTFTVTEPYEHLSQVRLHAICEEEKQNICLVNRLR